MPRRRTVLHTTRTVVPIALLLACTGSSTAPPPFPAFVDAYFDALYAYAPSLGTAAGLHQYDTIIEDRSAPAIARRVAGGYVVASLFAGRLGDLDHAKG